MHLTAVHRFGETVRGSLCLARIILGFQVHQTRVPRFAHLGAMVVSLARSCMRKLKVLKAKVPYCAAATILITVLLLDENQSSSSRPECPPWTALGSHDRS